MQTQFVLSATAGDVAIATMLLIFIFCLWSGVLLYTLRSKRWKR